MRWGLIAATAFLAIAQFAAAADAQALIRKPTEIPAEPLGLALEALAKQRGFQLVYVSEQVSHQRTQGASGKLTVDEALRQLLRGTGLTFKHVSDNGVSISPSSTSTSKPPSEQSANQANEGKARGSFSGSFRMAQVAHAAPGGAAAVGNGQSGGLRTLQEVIVTAQKRPTLLSETPIAISALDMGQLKDAGIFSIQDLTSAAPDVEIHTVGIHGFVGITIRGISNYDYTGTASPAVSTYVDGVYVGQSQGFANDLYDIQRVEILRGPQGTLYGRNATGGNINVITADPQPYFSSSGEVSYGNYNDVRTEGMINVPLSDDLAIRAAFFTHRDDGYFDTHGDTTRNYGAADDFGARLTALWKPSDNLKWRLSFDYSLAQGTPTESIDTGSNGLPLDGRPVYDQPVSSNPEPESYIRSSAVRSRIDWKISDSLAATYIAGYQSLRTHYQYASTGEVYAPASPTWADYVSVPSTWQSHEIDLNYDRGALKNVLGASYYEQNGPTIADVAGIFPKYGLYDGGSQLTPGEVTNAWGIYDQGTYSIIDHLRLTGGVRYSKERQYENLFNLFYCSIAANPGLTMQQVEALTATSPGCFLSPTPPGSGSWSNVSWKGSVEGDISKGTLGYVSVTTGFKSGGLQLLAAAPYPTTFLPEKVISYELGLKSRFFEDAASVRTALFDEQYTDLQVSQFLATSSEGLQNVTTNAGKAQIYGIEIEPEWNISGRDHISGFATYVHATYTDYHNAQDPATGITYASLDGNQLPMAPQESFRLEYSHDFGLPKGATLTPLAIVYWQSTSYLSPFDTDLYRVPAYSKTDMDLTYVNPSGQWKITAYVQNLENNAVRVGEYAGYGVFSDYDPPRLYGVRISYEQ